MRALGALMMVVCAGCGGVNSSEDGGTGSGADAATDRDAASTDATPGGEGPDSGSSDAGIVEATCAAPPVCASAGAVATREDIAAVGQRCGTWGDARVDSTRPRTPTLTVSQSTSICPGDFALPDDCAEGDCYAAIVVTVDPELDGVDSTAACGGAQLAAGARFRMRFHLDPPGVAQPFRTARVHFERPCDSECVKGEHLCEVNKNCYRDSEVCFACGYASLVECACRSPDNGILPNCTACEYIDESLYTGVCLEGLCEVEDPDPPDCIAAEPS